MSTPIRPSPLSFDSGRQSPFKRQNSASPATVRATTPTPSPTKTSSGFSPTKTNSLSPEKTSPFVRRPSQFGQSSPERPSSPFARSGSALSITSTPSRQSSTGGSRNDLVLPASPSRQRSTTPSAIDGEQGTPKRTLPAPSPSQLDGPEPLRNETPQAAALSPSRLRLPMARTPKGSPSSTTTPIRAPTSVPFRPVPPTVNRSRVTFAAAGTGYSHVPQPLLRSMREAFEVLDSSNTGCVTAASVTDMLQQMGLDSSPAHVREFFPPTGPSSLNLAKYLDTLSAPLADMSHPEELQAAFSAFDIDDSGQIDVAELHKAVSTTAPEPGEDDLRIGGRELDGILGEFTARRAFGSKSVGRDARTKGDVFRYKDFMQVLLGGGGMDDETEAGASV